MNQRFLKEIYYLNPYHWFLIEDYLSHEKATNVGNAVPDVSWMEWAVC